MLQKSMSSGERRQNLPFDRRTRMSLQFGKACLIPLDGLQWMVLHICNIAEQFAVPKPHVSAGVLTPQAPEMLLLTSRPLAGPAFASQYSAYAGMQTDCVYPTKPFVLCKQRACTEKVLERIVRLTQRKMVESQVDLRVRVAFGKFHLPGDRTSLPVEPQRLLGVEHFTM